MDKYKKLKCVQGLIISLDEQLYRNDNTGKNLEEVLVKSYFDAVKECLNES